MAAIKPVGLVDTERKAMARELITDIRRIDRALLENRRRCAEAVAASGSTLTEIFGISDTRRSEHRSVLVPLRAAPVRIALWACPLCLAAFDSPASAR